MRIGRHDIKHLAIIGAAGVAGLVATLAVFEAAEGPHVQLEPGIQPVPGEPGRVRVQVMRPARVGTTIQVVGPSADASPIVYIDGVRDKSVDDLTPEDILRIDVFKGPQAVERFGEEAAANGVIEVTTKKREKKKVR